VAKNLDELRAAIRTAGLRATPSRIAVLSLVRASDAPMSHGDVADQLATQSWDRATIYRNLTDLAEASLLRRTDVGDHVWRFEAHSDAQHPHFVCIDCGTVACLPEIELVVRRSAPRAVRKREVEVQMRGICDACS
jgi:Fur family ferric uptake transcriptional regulator